MAFWITSVSKVGQKCCGSGASAVAKAGITGRRIGSRSPAAMTPGGDQARFSTDNRFEGDARYGSFADIRPVRAMSVSTSVMCHKPTSPNCLAQWSDGSGVVGG